MPDKNPVLQAILIPPVLTTPHPLKPKTTGRKTTAAEATGDVAKKGQSQKNKTKTEAL
jgi:hypothetical protein